MNDFEKRIRVKLGKKSEDISVLGYEKWEKTEIDTSKLKHSVLATSLDVKEVDASKLKESLLSRKLGKEEEEFEHE